MRALLFILLMASCTPVPAADINLVLSILECESSGKHNAVGDSGVSYGIAQFNEETFYRFAKQANYKNFYYKNPIHQIRLLNWALDNGFGNHWTCYRKMKGVKK